MDTMADERVYTDETGAETLHLATELGVVAVSVSDDRIGEFHLRRRCRAHDVATAGGYVAAATDDDVVVCDRRADAGFVATGFGPATAVGFRGGRLLAGDAGGRVARLDADGGDPAEGAWTPVGSTGEVRAIDGDFIAAADGVYRVGSEALHSVGLDDARDVDREPLVAAGSGLYKLGNGWLEVQPDSAAAVDAAGDRGLAVCGGGLYARDDGAWVAAEVPFDDDATAAAVAHGTAAYAVTEAGRVAVRVSGGEWRARSLGVGGVVAAAV